MPTPTELREALRSMLLPTAPDREDGVVAAAKGHLDAIGVRTEDQGTWVLVELEQWRLSGKAGLDFRRMVGQCLRAGDPSFGDALAKRYFALHSDLASRPLFDHTGASAFLSHARLMAALAAEEALSAAQVSRVIAARDKRVPMTFDLVEMVLKALGLGPHISDEEMQDLFAEDATAEEDLLADADEAQCARLIGDIANRLGYPGALHDQLLTLAPPGGDVHGPYLQMLHYLCVVAEFYDHALSTLYEFDPRSLKGPPQWLFDQYPAALNVSGNPFLNNAKSVREIDRSWAWSKRGAHRAPAHALVSVIEGLESLGYAARQEIAAWLRRWLCRLIRLASGTGVTIPARLTAAQRRRLLARAATGNTQSRGVIEQRVVDSLTILLHPDPTWLARGIGDAVNANNVSRRKCGDADYQHNGAGRVVAYEPHGGTLTDVYIRGHRRTLEVVLKARRAEWDENVSPGLWWNVHVVYVAHSFALVGVISDHDFVAHGASVHFQAMTFADLIKNAIAATSEKTVAASLNEHLLGVMAQDRTPDKVRGRLLALIS